ncbi:hypothetical protein B0H13DRAFT_2318341 [Mycena leptocephala]|nr:hypothetical protein B0H13DRAFT_2318341 [Mycena leptocephala]
MLPPSPIQAAVGHDAHSVNDAQPPPSPGMPLPVQISDTPHTASLAKTISISAAAVATPRKHM